MSLSVVDDLCASVGVIIGASLSEPHIDGDVCPTSQVQEWTTRNITAVLSCYQLRSGIQKSRRLVEEFKRREMARDDR